MTAALPIGETSASPIETVLRGVRAMLLGNGGSKLALIAFEFLIAGLLGASFFGVYSIALSVAQIVSYLCLAGLNFGAVQYLSKYETQPEKSREVIFYALAVVLTASLAAAFLLAGGSSLIADKVFGKHELALGLAYAAPVVFFDAVNQVISSIFRGLCQFRNSLLCFDLLRNLVCFFGFGFLYVGGATLEKVMLLCSLGGVVGFAFGVFMLWKQGLLSLQLPKDLIVAKELFTFSRPLFLWNLLVIFVVRPYVVAGVFLTSAETGVFALASKLALGFIFFQTAVNSSIQAEFAKFHHQKDMPAQQKLYQAVSQGLLGVVSVLGIAVFTNPNFVMGLIGFEYAPYGWLLLPMLFAHFLNAVTGPAGHLLISNDRPKITIGLTLFDIFMLFGIFVPLTWAFGLTGAAIGETLRLVLFVILRLWLVHRYLGVYFMGRSYLRIAGAFLISTTLGICLTVAGINYFIAAGAALVLYSIGSVLIFLNDVEMRQELKILLRFKS